MARTHGNEQKHESKNPVQRMLIDRFHAEVVRLVRAVDPSSVLEVGCGEGYVLTALRAAGIQADLAGVDLSPTAIESARRRLGTGVDLRVADARELDLDGTFDLVMALEVLEHLERPTDLVETLGSLTGRAVLLSVPHEPWFRGLNLLRLKNVRDLGNDPEHVNHWSGRSFETFVSRHLRVVESGHAFPWTLVLAEPRR